MELSAPPTDVGSARDFVKALGRLTPEHREILLLSSVEELNYREIAEELDIPVGTVMSRLARARERLRSVMQGEGAEIIPLPLGQQHPVSKDRK
ncbi:RNA polymerase sigma factor [Nitrospirillum sp. BR 11163]|uniref:RNA polymerase sigma factor n=1 Tax=Nitrospirillum sp. BR 11163 TaxID=3104323 RepID=UPI002AFE8D73|nr:sigma-70 family RNA polymerase sigma factor [Nitrospirillum sp. BR 11163]MEA1671853.1 sigma-70 family RNA polymerase sigma factor [Nitrospirillum sp. BR 11163]